MRSGTTYFLAESTIRQIKPYDFNSPIGYYYRYYTFWFVVVGVLIYSFGTSTTNPLIQVNNQQNRDIIAALEAIAGKGNEEILDRLDKILGYQRLISQGIYNVNNTLTRLGSNSSIWHDELIEAIEKQTTAFEEAVTTASEELTAAVEEAATTIDAAVATVVEAIADLAVDVDAAIVAQTALLMAADPLVGTASLHSVWYQVDKTHSLLEKVYGRQGDQLISSNEVRDAARSIKLDTSPILESNSRLLAQAILLVDNSNATLRPIKDTAFYSEQITGYTVYTNEILDLIYGKL